MSREFRTQNQQVTLLYVIAYTLHQDEECVLERSFQNFAGSQAEGGSLTHLYEPYSTGKTRSAFRIFLDSCNDDLLLTTSVSIKSFFQHLSRDLRSLYSFLKSPGLIKYFFIRL